MIQETRLLLPGNAKKLYKKQEKLQLGTKIKMKKT